MSTKFKGMSGIYWLCLVGLRARVCVWTNVRMRHNCWGDPAPQSPHLLPGIIFISKEALGDWTESQQTAKEAEAQGPSCICCPRPGPTPELPAGESRYLLLGHLGAGQAPKGGEWSWLRTLVGMGMGVWIDEQDWVSALFKITEAE